MGLVSSGRDGEAIDAVTGQPKPSVTVPQGAWIATAEGVLRSSGAGASLEIADVLGSHGVFGRLVVGRAVEPVAVELVGPRSAKELAAVVTKLLELGAEVVLVDGALDRMAAASPKVTEATILVTGASVGSDLESLAQHLALVVWLLSRPRHPLRPVASLAEEALEKGRIGFIHAVRDKGQGKHILRLTNLATVLGIEDRVLEQAGDALAVVVPGAVSQAFLDKARSYAKHREFSVVAADPVSVFATRRPGVALYVAQPVNLLAVTVNPVGHFGLCYDPREMVSTLGAVLRDMGRPLPVFDVVSGERSAEEVTGMAVG